MSDARQFAEKILKGLGFDLDLIGDVPMHIADEIEQRDAAEVSALKAQCAAMLEKIVHFIELDNWHHPDCPSQTGENDWCTCNEQTLARKLSDAFISTDYAAALVEHDVIVHKQGFDAGFDGAERAAFEREREYVAQYESALAEVKRQARLEEAEWFYNICDEAHHEEFLGEGETCIYCDRLATLRAEGAKQP